MKKYDIAISFAGEDRHIAEQLASALVTSGMNVFYDEYEQADLWGKDLYVHLQRIYRDEAKFCLMLLSESYARKQWTNHERRSAQARAFAENSEYILPLKLDEAEIDGILGTTGYIDFRRTSVDQISALVWQKVREYNRKNGIKYEIVRVQDVLNTLTGHEFDDADCRTECPSCKTEQRLSEAPISVEDGDTLYKCVNGCQTIVVVGRPGIVAWPGRGFRIGDYVIRNVNKVFIEGLGLVIDESSAALMKKQPGST